MTTDDSAALMDDVFTSEDLEARYRLLKIIQDFLMSESSKFMAHEKSAHPKLIAATIIDFMNDV